MTTESDDDLTTELERIDNNVNGLYAIIGDLRDRIKELEEQNQRQQQMLESLRTQNATPNAEVATDGGVDE